MAARRRRGGNVTWYGDRVLADVKRATAKGIDQTMAECVKDAKDNTPTITTALQGSIMLRPAKIERSRIYGLWGSFDINYALPVEAGTEGGPVKVRAHRRRSRQGRTHSVRAHTRETRKREGRRMLRNAADREYPKLADRIATAFERRSQQRR